MAQGHKARTLRISSCSMAGKGPVLTSLWGIPIHRPPVTQGCRCTSRVRVLRVRPLTTTCSPFLSLFLGCTKSFHHDYWHYTALPDAYLALLFLNANVESLQKRPPWCSYKSKSTPLPVLQSSLARPPQPSSIPTDIPCCCLPQHYRRHRYHQHHWLPQPQL
jgi:hypothetical protein